MNYNQKFELWCRNVKDATLKAQLAEMIGNDKKIQDSFYKDLEFGTAGQRGIIGPGTNCLNIFTIAKTTQGIAECLKRTNSKSVFISFDSRINSDLFSKTAACVFVKNGLKVFITQELQPTPFVSFGTRKLKCDAGVMITASHNPSQFNGYKLYSSDGCQVAEQMAEDVTKAISAIDCFAVELADFDESLKNGMIEFVPQNIYDDYFECVKKQHLNDCDDIKIVYSPLNGTGWKFVPKILQDIGVKNLVIVDEQSSPDGNFPTCPYPNPEKKEALALGIEYAKKTNSDLLIATDPDADRVGTAVKHHGEYVILSGNEMGLLIMNYLLESRKNNGTLPNKPVVIKTIVTSTLATKLANKFGAQIVDVLTGFKYIGNQMDCLEKDGRIDDFIVGFEESCGYLIGAHARDKDAIVTSMILAEYADLLKKQGKTFVDKLNEMYDEFGLYSHKTISKEFAGASGNEKMKTLLADFRKMKLTEVGEKKIIEKIDLSMENKLKLPWADVVILNLEDNAQLIVRPSGTEPLIKFYMTAAQSKEKNLELFQKIIEFVEQKFV